MARQNKSWNHSYLIIAMVREIAATWNPIYDSILLMYKKLKDIGLDPTAEPQSNLQPRQIAAKANRRRRTNQNQRTRPLIREMDRHSPNSP